MVVELNDENFKQAVLENDKLFLVDMYAEWCPPCKVMAPLIDKISQDYEDKIKVGKLNVDKARMTAIHYNIEVIPTLLLFKQGQVVDKIIGLVPPEVLIQKINSNL